MNKNWLVLPALVCTLLVQAPAQPPAPSAGIVGIAHVALRVSDLDREIAFLGKLGFEESFALANDGRTMAVLVKIDDRQFIELSPQTSSTDPLGWIRVCFEAGDLRVLAKYFASIGLKPSPIRKTESGNLVFSMHDPDGRLVEFTEYMPGSRHMLDRGQHIGESRIATEFLGLDLPGDNLAAEKQFYVQLGFEAEDDNGNVRLTAPGAPHLRIELRPAHPGALPQLLFPVSDARKAAAQLKDAGAKPIRDGKIVFVRDPDGNPFVFLETGSEHKDKFMPWKH